MNLKFGSKKNGQEPFDLMEDFGATQQNEEVAPAPQKVSQSGTLQMKLMRPSELKEATAIADCLKGGQTVVLNLDDIGDDTARRLIDYIAGVVYALGGKIDRPSERTFLLTPNGKGAAGEKSE